MEKKHFEKINRSLKTIEESLFSINNILSGLLLIHIEKGMVDNYFKKIKSQDDKFLYFNKLGINKEIIALLYDINPKTVGEKISRAKSKEKQTEKRIGKNKKRKK